MKNLLLGFAVLGLAIACKSADNASVSDSSNVTAPAAECSSASAGCEDADAAACGDAKAAACGDAEAAASSCCSEQKQDAAAVCPVTGEVQN